MSRKIISTDEQIQKISKLQKLANEAVKSKEIIERLGGITVYAGIADYLAVQSARLLEQIILKSELSQHKQPSFQPKDDSYFYDKRVSTRSIVKEIRRFLPVSVCDGSLHDIQRVNEVVEIYLCATEDFLDYRNALLHHMCSPKTTEISISDLIEKTITSFVKMRQSHQNFFETWGPYRFGLNEMEYFYGNKQNGTNGG